MSRHFSGRIHEVINPTGESTLVVRIYPPHKADQLRDMLKMNDNPTVHLVVDE